MEKGGICISQQVDEIVMLTIYAFASNLSVLSNSSIPIVTVTGDGKRQQTLLNVINKHYCTVIRTREERMTKQY